MGRAPRRWLLGCGFGRAGLRVETMVFSNMQLARELGGLGLAEMEGRLSLVRHPSIFWPLPPASSPKVTTTVLSVRAKSRRPWEERTPAFGTGPESLSGETCQGHTGWSGRTLRLPVLGPPGLQVPQTVCKGTGPTAHANAGGHSVSSKSVSNDTGSPGSGLAGR